MTKPYRRFTPYSPSDTKPRVRFDWKEGGWYVTRKGLHSDAIAALNAIFGRKWIFTGHEDGHDYWGARYRACAIPLREG